MKTNKQQSGSALLIAMLMIGTIGAILVAASRTNIIKLRTATNIVQSHMAYWAARAGIEEGLLAYRSNKDVQVPYSTITPNDEPSENSSNYRRVVLSTNPDQNGQIQSGTNSSISPNSDQPYYDLKIYYKASEATGTMLKDDIKSFAIKSNSTYSVHWEVKYSDNTAITVQPKAFLELTTMDKNNSLTKLSDPNQVGQTAVYAYIGDISATGVDGLMQIKLIMPQTENTAVPNFDKLVLSYRITSNNGLVDTGTTYIESIGYFGDVKRKLVAKVDRIAGSLINIFDYTLYSNGGI